MLLELLIARWVAILWLVCGVSHALYPAKWAALLAPLRERDTGGLLLAAFNFPMGLWVVLGHNVWVWDLPVIVTVAGWLTTLKSGAYLLFPGAHRWVMPAGDRIERGFRAIGIVLIALGMVTFYDAFIRR